MIPALISAGASILGSVLGGKKSSNRINYKQMVRDAEAAGFNPLTALRNGGSAGYMQGGNPTALSRIGDGLGQFGNFIANFDPLQDDKREAEFQLVQAQIANLNADTSNKVKFGQVPSYTAGNKARVMGEGVAHGQSFKSAAVVLPPSAGAPQTPTVEKPTVTNPYPTDSGVTVNPALSDASSWEERYGEPGDWIGGVLTLLGDGATWVNDWQQGLKRAADERHKPGKGKPFNRSDRIYIPPALHR